MSFLGLPRLPGLPQVRQPSAREDLPARCIWLTGLPGAGKTTLANALEQRLRELGRPTCVLDGDSLRTGLCRDLASRRPTAPRTSAAWPRWPA
jgi:adenylylsulfate kinase-like enzyme